MEDPVRKMVEAVISGKKEGEGSGPAEFRPVNEPGPYRRTSVNRVWCEGEFGLGLVSHSVEKGDYMAEGEYLFLVHMPSHTVKQVLKYDPWEDRKGALSVAEFSVEGEETKIVKVTLNFKHKSLYPEIKDEQPPAEEILLFGFRPGFVDLQAEAAPWQPGKLRFVL